MKRLIRNSLVALNNRLFLLSMIPFFLASVPSHAQYQPSEDNIKSRKEFSDCKFGIFLHWGIYSMFGQGEWYMNDAGIDCQEYAKAASGFYPSRFDADEWISIFKNAGAKYICFTTHNLIYIKKCAYSSFYNLLSPVSALLRFSRCGGFKHLQYKKQYMKRETFFHVKSYGGNIYSP